jgi:hypothetical protein
MIKTDQYYRLQKVIDQSWDLLFKSIISGRFTVNKESSMQLHLAKILFELGNLYCTEPGEYFSIEMESDYEKKSIDIICSLGDVNAAIELKCFIKSSKRAADLDMYDVLKDVERLENYNGFQIKRFICLTDNAYYPNTEQKGYAKSVSVKNGTKYIAGQKIIPDWAGKWKVKRDKEISLKNDLICNWISNEKWHYLSFDIN